MPPATEFVYRIGAAARRSASWLQLLKFGIVGGSGYLLNLLVFALATEGLGLHHLLGAVLAFCVAVSNNFMLNRHWTFAPGEDHPAFQAARFLTVSVGALLVNLAVLEALLWATSLGALAAQAIAVLTATPLSFAGNKLWTFAS